MARRRTRSQLDAMDQINVTPLLDLTFILLIVFMISMPLMQHGLDVTPPKANADTLPENHTCNISVDSSGAIKFKTEYVSERELVSRLQAAFAADPEIIVLLTGDESQSYGKIVDVWKLVRSAGISRVRLVTAAE